MLDELEDVSFISSYTPSNNPSPPLVSFVAPLSIIIPIMHCPVQLHEMLLKALCAYQKERQNNLHSSPSGQIFSSRPISPGKKATAPIPSTATESPMQPRPKNNSPKTSNKIIHLVFIIIQLQPVALRCACCPLRA